MHELGHFRHWLEEGKLPKAKWDRLHYADRDHAVFEWLRENFWDKLNLEQQNDAKAQFFRPWLFFRDRK